MTSGGQCVMTAGTPLMLLWSADSWDMHTLEVSLQYVTIMRLTNIFYVLFLMQLVDLSAMPSLVLVPVPSSWMMSSVLQVLVSYWSAPVGQSYPITVFILLMLVSHVKVCS